MYLETGGFVDSGIAQRPEFSFSDGCGRQVFWLCRFQAALSEKTAFGRLLGNGKGLRENCISGGQRHQTFSQAEDFSRQPPGRR
jgi:hypothetical protein